MVNKYANPETVLVFAYGFSQLEPTRQSAVGADNPRYAEPMPLFRRAINLEYLVYTLSLRAYSKFVVVQ